MSNSSQIAANRSNAQHSTGPKTEAGKARSSINALKSGLTGRTVLLAGDDLEAYGALLNQLTARHQPVTPDEKLIVQKIVDTEWRLARIPELMAGIEAIGRRELAAQLEEELKDEEESVRAAVLRTRIHLAYRKELGNLSLQESRLRRQREKDLVELSDLQQPRRNQERINAHEAVEACRSNPAEFTREYFRENGFEFSDELWNEKLFDTQDRRTRHPNRLIDKIRFRPSLELSKQPRPAA